MLYIQALQQTPEGLHSVAFLTPSCPSSTGMPLDTFQLSLHCKAQKTQKTLWTPDDRDLSPWRKWGLWKMDSKALYSAKASPFPRLHHKTSRNFPTGNSRPGPSSPSEVKIHLERTLSRPLPFYSQKPTHWGNPLLKETGNPFIILFFFFFKKVLLFNLYPAQSLKGSGRLMSDKTLTIKL